MRTSARLRTILALFTGLVAVGLVVTATWTRGQPQPGAKAVPAGELTSYRDVVKKVLPAVVSIQTRSRKAPARATPFGQAQPPDDDFGSGFIVAPTGVVLTSFHIVAEAERVVVRLPDGRKYTSKDIRGDARSDLAIVVLDTKGAALPCLELGDSDAMEIGDRVLAVGAPFGLTGSVTHGIVSGTGRDLNINLYEDFLQTDAAINPGNSGGPLINLDGKAIGVCAAIKSRSGGFQGVGLAVASNLARDVVAALRKDGVVQRGYLGLQARDLEPEVAARLGVPQGGGIVVAHVFANTPADKARLQPGDILRRVDGKAIRNTKALQSLVARLPIGPAVDLEFVRDGKTESSRVALEEQPANYSAAVAPAPRVGPFGVPSLPLVKLGLHVGDLPADLAKDLGYPAGVRGILITHVDADGKAADAGLRAGMLIHKIDGAAVATAADARQRLEAATADHAALLQVRSPEGGVTYALLAAN